MKIKLLTALSGPSGSFAVGDVIERNADEARRLVDAKFAEAAEAWPKNAGPPAAPPAPSTVEDSADEADTELEDRPTPDPVADPSPKPKKKK